MKKCFVTKLQGSVDNPSLLRLGEVRIKLNEVNNPTAHTQGFSLEAIKPVTLEIIGDGYFTNDTLTQNLGKTKVISSLESIWVSNGAEIAVLDKYNLKKIINYYQGEDASKIFANNLHLDLSDLSYSNALTDFVMYNTQISGNIEDLKTLTALTYLNITGTQISGNIGDLKTLTALTSINIGGGETAITGDIGELSTLTKLSEMNLYNCKLTGDLATLPASFHHLLLNNSAGSTLTWSTRPSSSKIISIISNAVFTNVDKMLQDQAKCQVGFSASDPNWYKIISVTGKRTSVSDEAVHALQQKGYTITIEKV